MSTRRTTIHAASGAVRGLVSDLVGEAGLEVKARAYRTANELQNQLNNVMRGERSGRRYKVPGTYARQKDTGELRFRKARNGRYYTASAPGEPPAVRTGAFRLSWHRRTYAEELAGHEFNVHGVTESDLRVGKHLLGNILEDGTDRMAPRPYKQRVIDAAMPKIRKIYTEPYFRR